MWHLTPKSKLDAVVLSGDRPQTRDRRLGDRFFEIASAIEDLDQGAASWPRKMIWRRPHWLHSLGKMEAVRRIKTGLELVKNRCGKIIIVQEEVWSDDKLQFRVAALGQFATGTIDVADDNARLEDALPWLLAKVAENLQTVMLEKK